MPFPVPRMRDLLTRRQYGEVSQAHLYTDALTGGRTRFRVESVDVECHEPPTGRVTGHGHRRRVNVGRVQVRPRPDKPKRSAHLSQVQRAVLYSEGRPGVAGRLPGVPGFEPRIPGTLFPERGERGLLGAKCLLQ